VLTIKDLTRVYGDRTVLDRVSFDVRPGAMTGFVGANGAGKTTTMRIIVGVLAATAGTVSWDGAEIGTRQRRSIGYLPEERGLYPKMSSIDQLVYFGRLHGLTASDAGDRARSLLDRLGLLARAGDPVEKLSLGNQQRVQVAAALIHRPAALVLDEPFSGLDPLAVDAMVALLREELADPIPVLFSSHQLELVERLCDDLVVLAQGRVVAAGTVEELRAEQAERYRVTLADDQDAGWLRELPGLPGLRVLDVTGPQALLELGAEPAAAVLAAVVARAGVSEFARVVRPLSEIYREAVR
jgi:ABC-2 type transport system ATP-binding protein